MRLSFKPFFGLVLCLCVVLAVVRADNADVESWVSSDIGLLKLSSMDGSGGLADAGLYPVIAVDSVTQNLWTYSNGTLQAFDPAGNLLLSSAVPATSSADVPVMAVDGVNGYIALGVGRSLHWFDLAGNALGDIELPAAVTTLAVDSAKDVLWIGASHVYQSHSRGMPVPSDLGNVWQDARRVVFDPFANVLWVLRYDAIERHDVSDNVSASFEFPSGGYVSHIAADGSGGLWAADHDGLYHVSRDGSYSPEIRVFAGSQAYWWWGSMTVLDVVADPLDGSVWVVGDRMIRHYDAGGNVVAELHSELPDGTRPRLHALAYSVDVHSPVLKIVSPGDGDVIADNRPGIQLTYVDVGGSVAPESVAVYVDDQLTVSTCDAKANRATCRPQALLEDGERKLGAEIADSAGNVTSADVVTVRIDTVAPRISITKPQNNLATNAATVSIAGVVSESVSLTLDGEPLSVDAQGAFSAERKLAEGSNVFHLVAEDAAGNVTAHDVSVQRDTFVPLPLSSSSVRIMLDGEVWGVAGTAEAGARITIRNARSGETVSVRAGADGSFAASMPGKAGDVFEFVVTDAAGNVSASFEMTVASRDGEFQQMAELPYDPQTALMTVIEPELEVDKTSASPLGDDYDPVGGGVTFSVTDISIPGNFEIPVELRRWVPSDDYDTGGPTGWTWNIPFIKGNYLDVKDGHDDTGWDWGPNTWHNGKNCSGDADTVVTANDDLVAGNAYWQGKLLHIPGVTSETFLTDSGEQITKSNFRVAGCINNASGQEGIIVEGPNGLTYTFNQIKSYYNGKIALKDPIVRTRLLMVTKIEDRFGNYVNYTYSNGELSQISASDGRSISISYADVGGKRRPTTATAHGRTWTYAYEGSSALDKLASVTLPDGVSKWEYNNVTVVGFDPNPTSYSQQIEIPDHIPTCTTEPTQHTATVKNPWGLTSTYTFKKVIQGRSDVEPDTYADQTGDTAVTRAVNCTVKLALIAKSIAGPGISTANWTYTYSNNAGTYSASSGLNNYLTGPFDLPQPAVGGYPAPITSGTAVDYRSTTVTGPDRKIVFYIDRKFQSITENRVVAQDTLNAAGTQLLKRTQSVFTKGDQVGVDWYMCPCDGMYPPVNREQLRYRINQTQAVEKYYLSGGTDTYTNSYSNFDPYGFYLNSQESNSFGYQRSTTRTFLHDTANGLIGLPLTEVVNGVMVAENHYNALGQLEWIKSFGKLKATLTYDNASSVASGQRGTLKTVKDGNNNISTLSNWKRGTPQHVLFADGSSRSGTVNDSGWLMSTTDENDYTTSYTYDDMGQLASITRPTGDSTAWAATTRSVVPVGSAEFGIPAGHWRVTVVTGNARKITYYDALLRPLLKQEYDAADQAGTQRFHRFSYDLDGRVTFAGYPSTSSSVGGSGTSTTYDALGRTLSVSQDSELGELDTVYSYLSDSRTRVTNPRGYQTTTTYMAYGQPGTEWPVLIAHPAGMYTHIERDAFGKPEKIRRSNSSSPTGGTLAVDRSYAYNTHQELCRSVEPEIGATLFGYDAAGNLTWSSAGLPIGTACETAGTSPTVAARRVDRSYDERNRLETLAFPDGRGDQVWTYTPDGLPEQVTTYNAAGGGDAVVNSYTYNKRRLLTAEAMTQPGQDALVTGYGYDANGALDSIAYPSGRHIVFTPNALGQASKAGIYATGASYYANGALAQFTYGNGIVHTMAQNARQLPLSSVDGTVLNLATTYDANGNVAGITDGTAAARQTRAMTYDELDRLTGTTSPMFGTASYTYDVLDNLTHVEVSAGSNPRNHDYCYTGNQLSSVNTGGCDVGGTTVTQFTYDVQGNLSAKGAQAYAFDYGNRLREATGQESYRYDAHGRRVYSHTAAGDIYSLYGQDGVLRHMDNRRTSEQIDYVYLGGSLVTEATETVAAIAAPTLTVPATSTTGSYTVNWTTVPTATRYELQERVEGSGWVLIQDSGATSASISGKDTANYSYRVRSCIADDCGLWNTPPGTIAVTLPVPAAPTLSAPPATNSTGDYMVSWAAVNYAFSYKVEEKIGSGAWLTVERIEDADSTSEPISDKLDGEYSYRVTACNGSGCSASSAVRTTVVTHPPTGIPSLGTLPATDYTGSYTVSWSTVTAATSYKLEEKVNTGGWSVIQSTSATSKAFSGKGTATYSYRVSACNAGGCADESTVKSIAVTRPPAAPAFTSLTLAKPSGKQWNYAASWTSPAHATSYKLFGPRHDSLHDPVEVYAGSGTSHSYGIFDVDEPTAPFSVQACNVAGCSGFSAPKHPVGVPVLTAPSTNTSGSYTVSWTTATAATSYKLQERVGSGSWSQVYSGSGLSKSFSGKATGTYSYRAYACNAEGCGDYSIAKSVSVTRIPVAPSFTSATLTKPSGRRWRYSLAWTSSAGATRYELWGPNLDPYDQELIYNGSNTSYVHEVFSFDEPTVPFYVRACNSVGCSAPSAWVLPH